VLVVELLGAINLEWSAIGNVLAFVGVSSSSSEPSAY